VWIIHPRLWGFANKQADNVGWLKTSCAQLRGNIFFKNIVDQLCQDTTIDVTPLAICENYIKSLIRVMFRDKLKLVLHCVACGNMSDVM